jgi:coenzyme PQQ synthesis protein D (PqqD)
VVFRDLGGESVLLDLESGVYYGLDAVGTRVWMLLMEGLPLAAVCARIEEEYDVDRARLEDDVRRLVGELCDRRLVEPLGAP